MEAILKEPKAPDEHWHLVFATKVQLARQVEAQVVPVKQQKPAAVI